MIYQRGPYRLVKEKTGMSFYVDGIKDFEATNTDEIKYLIKEFRECVDVFSDFIEVCEDFLKGDDND